MAGPIVLWDHLEQLHQLARDLRRLSEEEPLRKARPDYPRARIGRSHDDEVRRVLEGISAGLDALEQLVPQVLEDGGSVLGLVPAKAVTLSTGVEAVVGALRNAVLRQLNAEGGPSLGSAL